jgi:hypothetical protein
LGVILSSEAGEDLFEQEEVAEEEVGSALI